MKEPTLRHFSTRLNEKKEKTGQKTDGDVNGTDDDTERRTPNNVRTVRGDIFDSGAEVLVSPNNCVGSVGMLAGAFARWFPNETREYVRAARAGEVRLGEVLLVERRDGRGWIAYFPTMYHPGSRSRLSDVEEGLRDLAKKLEATKVKSVAVPCLGCGVGRLPFPDVKWAVEKAFSGKPNVQVKLYEPL